MRELLLPPAHWPEEVTKVRQAYATAIAQGRAILVPVSFTTTQALRYILTPAACDKVTTKTIRDALKKKVLANVTFATEEELGTHLTDLIGKARGPAALQDMKGACFRSGRQHISDATMTAIATACAPPKPRITHVRWFGHGIQGRICGESGHLVDLRGIATVIAQTQTPILSIYCCLTGAKKMLAHPSEYWHGDAPSFILRCIDPPAAYGPVVVNTNINPNFWSGDVHANLVYPFDRHTLLAIDGSVNDLSAAACKLAHDERDARIAHKRTAAQSRWGLVRKQVLTGAWRAPSVQVDQGNEEQ